MTYSSRPPIAPVVREIRYADPADLAARLHGARHLTFLDSALRHKQLGRYSYLACDPFVSIGVAKGDPLADVRQALDRYRLASVEGLPPFQGGLAGYLAYELGALLEPDAGLATGDSFPPVVLHGYDVVVAFDHQLGKAWIVSSGFPEEDAARRTARAESRLDQMMQRLSAPEPKAGPSRIAAWDSNFMQSAYERAVARTVDLILDGDIFQANIAQRFTSQIPAQFDAYAFYRRLRRGNPAPFAAYLDFGALKIASSSPERLLCTDGRLVEARPIKGTIRRDPDPQADAALIAELQSSRKDRAENVMIVDLLRNDLSKVCRPGSVQVPVLCGLESYATVHHLVSVVTGELKQQHSALDAIRACFPGGSITGAPKIRAMQIIAEIEAAPRQCYCGSIGYLGFDGSLDLNIAIRTVQFYNGIATVNGGGGITARSNPRAEYEESLVKVRRILDVFAAAP